MSSPTRDGRLTPSGVKGAWDRIKAEEKAERAARRPPEQRTQRSLLSGVKAGQPALTRAMELQRKASTVGFDWNDPRAVLNKIREEADEIEAALDRGDADELAEETGDLLFALVNLARHVGADPDQALRGTNAKFERRFGYIERALAVARAVAGECVAGRDGRVVERGEGRGSASVIRASRLRSESSPMNPAEIFGGLLAGGVGGIASGFLGITSGGILVPLLILLLGKDQHVAQGISLVAQVVPTSLSGVRNYHQSGHRVSACAG